MKTIVKNLSAHVVYPQNKGKFRAVQEFESSGWKGFFISILLGDVYISEREKAYVQVSSEGRKLLHR